MRVRKTINFYYNEPAHADLLDYLESIEGSSRRQAQLLQMALIGFRVMANQESGVEALLKARNPDLPTLLKGKSQLLIEGGLPKAKRVDKKNVKDAPLMRNEPACTALDEPPAVEAHAGSPVIESSAHESRRGPSSRSNAIPRGMVPRPDPPSAVDDMDPLLKLQQLIDQ